MENSELICRNSRCHVLDHGQCELGEPNFRRCSNFGSNNKAIADVDAQDEEDTLTNEVRSIAEEPESAASLTFPWNSDSFGLDDIRFIAARSQLHTVALFGAYSAGKTTFLATLYLLLVNGAQLDSKSFAGSLTLSGWESLAHSLKIQGARFSPGKYPHFPLHTAARNAPIPGLLHLAFRGADDTFRDFLFTDPPGEWFERWADNEHDPSTEGARWMARRATKIAIFADSDALAGTRRGEERLKLSSLMLRISSSTSSQPVALVWAKSDILVKDVIRNQIEDEYNESFRGRQTQIFHIAAVPLSSSSQMKRGQGVLELVDWLTQFPQRRDAISKLSDENINSFLLYQG